MNYLGKATLGKGLLKQEPLTVEAWGGSILIRELTGAEVERVRVIAATAVKNGIVADNSALGTFGRALIAAGWINEDGSRVLTDEEADLLADESNQVLELISGAISKLSGLTKAAADDAEKN